MSAESTVYAMPGASRAELDAATRIDCHAVLAQHGKSFAMAVSLLGATQADRAACVYAYCRRVDDAIDCCPPEQTRRALARLAHELDMIYQDDAPSAPEQRAFRELAISCQLPKRYPLELLKGMAMDVNKRSYETLPDLLLYCHRVAGVVGLMMCHVFGIERETALLQAAQLGIAMQLTNICRDVAEDYARGRLYLPRALLRAAGAPRSLLNGSGSLPTDAASRSALARVTGQLLRVADAFYRAAEAGIDALPFRAGLAVRVARRLYAAIGSELVARECDPGLGRAVVSRGKRRWLVALAVGEHLLSAPRLLLSRSRARAAARLPRTELMFSAKLLAPVLSVADEARC